LETLEADGGWRGGTGIAACNLGTSWQRTRRAGVPPAVTDRKASRWPTRR